MAITNNGVKNSLPTAQIPSGYTRPTVTEFTDYKYVYSVVLDVLKVTVDEPVASTTMTAIIENATIGLEKQIDDILAEDFIGTRTVTAWADWTAFDTNMTATKGTDPLLTDAATNYQCTVKIYIKTAA